MIITTWNVNGIRAAIKKDFHEWAIDQNADLLCIQEIKAKREQIEEEYREIPGYISFWNSAERPGYSGVAAFVKENPDRVSYGLGDERFDNEGRVIRLDYGNLVIFNIYFPNGQRGHDRVEYKLDFYARLLEICDELHANGKQIIITGDFNTAHQEIDLANPKENENTSGFMPEERAWVQKFLDHGFIDAYRYFHPQEVKYTWWTYRFRARERNIGWRLDYFLVTDSLITNVTDVIIHDNVFGSDHCPVTLDIQC